MKRLALAVLVACGSSDETPPVSHAQIEKLLEKACPEVSDPALYRIDKDGQTSWLLGTRHISVALGKFPPKMLSHIRYAKVIVFEIAPDAPSPPQPPYTGKPLREILGDARWDKYRAIVGDRVAALTPSPLSASLAMAMLFENPTIGLEKELAHFAADVHVPAVGLETHAFQRELLTDTLGAELGALIDGNTREKIETATIAGLHAYCSGTDSESVDALGDKLGTERNKKWLPNLEVLHADGGAFIAVGAGHLRGPQGLVALLKADGYTVTRTLD